MKQKYTICFFLVEKKIINNSILDFIELSLYSYDYRNKLYKILP